MLYLFVAPPAFLLGPLAGLLVCARPGSWREWAWLLVAVASMGYWLFHGGDIAEQSARALSVLAAGAFVALTLLEEGTPVARALIATGLGVAALVAWCVIFDVTWYSLRLAIGRGLESALRLMVQQTPAASKETADAFAELANAAPAWAVAMPGVAFLQSVTGMLLAWSLHRRIAQRPLGPAAPPFVAFRFSDQLVWVVIAGLGLVLFPATSDVRDVGANLLLIGGLLYAARGLAVVRSAAGRLTTPTAVAIGFAALMLLPFVLSGLTLLGLADTWVDFRRRLPPPTTGGVH